jgi:hypothetical protein
VVTEVVGVAGALDAGVEEPAAVLLDPELRPPHAVTTSDGAMAASRIAVLQVRTLAMLDPVRAAKGATI